MFGSALPFDEAVIKRWATPFLEPYLNAHDANQNGVIEEPEMIALYVIELARGRGLDAVTLQVQGRPATAQQTTSADISGLMDYSRVNRRALDTQTRKLFDDIEFYGPRIMDRPDDRPDGRESKSSWIH